MGTLIIQLYYRKAKHLLNYVRAKEPRLYLQSGLDDATTLPGFRIQTADDHIIKACLQLKQKGKALLQLIGKRVVTANNKIISGTLITINREHIDNPVLCLHPALYIMALSGAACYTRRYTVKLG